MEGNPDDSFKSDLEVETIRCGSEIGNIMSGDTYIFRWDRHGRKGQPCLVLARGTMNSCLVKFEDGYTMVTSRNALQRRHEHSNPSAETIPAR